MSVTEPLSFNSDSGKFCKHLQPQLFFSCIMSIITCHEVPTGIHENICTYLAWYQHMS